MTLRSNNEIKAAIVARLKDSSTIVAELSNSRDIKEAQWQGTEFVYPAIRVLVRTNDHPNNDCDYTLVTASVLVFSEEYSSLEADRIAGIIRDVLHKKSFTSNSVAFTGMRVTNLVPAIRNSRNTWRSEAILRSTVN